MKIPTASEGQRWNWINDWSWITSKFQGFNRTDPCKLNEFHCSLSRSCNDGKVPEVFHETAILLLVCWYSSYSPVSSGSEFILVKHSAKWWAEGLMGKVLRSFLRLRSREFPNCIGIRFKERKCETLEGSWNNHWGRKRYTIVFTDTVVAFAVGRQRSLDSFVARLMGLIKWENFGLTSSAWDKL